MKKFTFLFLIKEIALGVLNALFVVLVGALIAIFFIYKYQTPDVRDLSNFHFSETSTIYDRTGKVVLYEIHGEENRKLLEHSQIPEVVRIATVAAEDKNFYSHFGLDFFSIFRALKNNVDDGGIYQGGSTITQQLARNVYLTREKTLLRKFMEALIAIKLERNFTKDQILDMYLNVVPYGSNAYGIQAASKVFFGKDAKDLTLDEAVLLASLPKAPTYYSPYGNNVERLKARYGAILNKTKELNLINDQQLAESKKIDVLSKLRPFSEPIIAPHFVFYVIEKLEEKYGQDFLEKGGLSVITTLDLGLQTIGEKVVAEGVKKNLVRRSENGALVALDPKSGEILAMIGSRNYFDQEINGQVNVAIRPRQPGSSFKPIVYATAFEKGYQPETLIADEETNFGPDGGGLDYIPKNYDGKYHGVLPMRKTLAMSLNIPAIKTLQKVGIDSAIDMAHRLGISTINDRKRYGLSLAIGGAEVKLLDLTYAFSVFANDGNRMELYPIREIIGPNGELFRQKIQGSQVIDSDVARKINSILSDNSARSAIFGPNSPLYIPGRSVAAKTGTTQEFRDAWTVGYTPSLAVGVWTGNNDSRPMAPGSDGVFVAAPIWRAFLDQALANYPNESFIGYNQSKSDEKVLLSKDDVKQLEKDEKKKKKEEAKKNKKKKK